MTSGDFNKDGKVDSSDLALLRNLITQAGHSPNMLDRLPPEDRALLDVNQDGEINYDDVVALCQSLLKTSKEDAQEMADKFQAMRRRAKQL